MKRYSIFSGGVLNRPTLRIDANGEWVEYKDVEKLKELNREMVEALKEVTSNYYDDYTLPQSVVTHVRQVLQKVKAEVQGE